MKSVLTIATSDCSGGAGIQADLKTIAAHKMYGMSAICALTAQNTIGVSGVFDVSADFVTAQLDSIFTDIVPDAVKIGMVWNSEIINAICASLKKYKPRHIVVDPVMISTSGSRLLAPGGMETLVEKLIPIADLVTPNLMEAEALSDIKIASTADMIAAAVCISKKMHGAVLVKGGHFESNADDLLYANGESIWFHGERINNPNTHGTGCTLSSAIACNLAAGMNICDAVRAAKDYITGALRDGLDLGHGSGPLNHMYIMR
ncbi:MAG: bifunctional hydroxymethylpyrimidine kinase/phosphomethylpyrimidine kinase [Clostridia bacterium]